jgi:hypothetical protein
MRHWSRVKSRSGLPRGRGEIGRHAGFRCRCSKELGGSNPSARIALPSPGGARYDPRPSGAVAQLAKAPVSKTGDSRFESWLPRYVNPFPNRSQLGSLGKLNPGLVEAIPARSRSPIRFARQRQRQARLKVAVSGSGIKQRTLVLKGSSDQAAMNEIALRLKECDQCLRAERPAVAVAA